MGELEDPGLPGHVAQRAEPAAGWGHLRRRLGQSQGSALPFRPHPEAPSLGSQPGPAPGSAPLWGSRPGSPLRAQDKAAAALGQLGRSETPGPGCARSPRATTGVGVGASETLRWGVGSRPPPPPPSGQATALSPPEGEAFGALGRGPQGGGTHVDRSWPPFSPAHEDSGPAAPLQARGQSHAEAGGDSPSKRPPILPGGRRGCLPPPL